MLDQIECDCMSDKSLLYILRAGTMGSGVTVYMLASRNPYRTVDVTHPIYNEFRINLDIRMSAR